MSSRLTPEKIEIYNDLADWLDDYANFEDTSVGICWLGELDQRKVEDLKESFEFNVVAWDKTSLIIRVNKLRVYMKLVDFFGESRWVIAEIN